MAEENFSELGKNEAIARLFEGTPYKPFTDNSFITTGKERIFGSSRLFLEGIDFNLVYFPLKHLGYKCVTAVTADLYAKVAEPHSLSINLGISAKLDYSKVSELWDGMVAAAKEHGYKSLTLDLVPSRNGLSIALAANGAISLTADKRRMPVKSMDLICISNNIGGAFLGFKVLENAEKEFEKTGRQPELDKWKKMVGAYLKPELENDVAKKLKDAEIMPSYGYVVDKGLADAVKKLVRDSGLGAKVYVDKLPFEAGSFDLGRELNIDPVTAAFNGGDDYRLMFVIPIASLSKFRHDFQTFDIIGHLAKPDVGAVLVSPDGVEFPLSAQGW